MIQNNDDNRTELSAIGEFGLIQKIAEKVTLYHPTTVFGIGDDAAVISPAKKNILVSSDILAENIHFNLSYTPLKHLGYKSVVVNVSDIYAMYGIPTQIIVSIAVSNRFSVEAIEELYEGIHLACKYYNVDLVGGDTTSSSSGLVISITAIGETDTPVYRSGAQEHDLLCVSGDLGGAYAGLQILERERLIFEENKLIQPDLSGYEYVLERQLKPEAKKNIIEMLYQKKVVPTSMIDISDGLSSEILHICDASKKGCALYEEKIPIDYETIKVAEELNIEPLICALNGGEDYELLFTISQKDYDKIKDEKKVHIIGHIQEQSSGNHLITKSGVAIQLKAKGWKHL